MIDVATSIMAMSDDVAAGISAEEVIPLYDSCCWLPGHGYSFFFFFFKQKTAYEITRWTGVQTCALPISASHAQSPETLKALADLVVDDGDKREAAVTVLGTTRDPKWLEFLGALRDGNVYARGQGEAAEVVIGGAKSTKGDQDVIDIVTAYGRRPLGTVPVAGLTEIAADRRLRIAIKPFLDADETRGQLASLDPESRRGAAMQLGRAHV